jgi:hypothetical protein
MKHTWAVPVCIWRLGLEEGWLQISHYFTVASAMRFPLGTHPARSQLHDSVPIDMGPVLLALSMVVLA